ESYLSRVPVLKGVLVALLIQLVLVLLLTTVFHFSSLSDNHMGMLSILIILISVVGGGMGAAKAAEARFLLNGFGVGLTCLIIVCLVSLLRGNGFDMAAMGVRTLCYLGAGTVGGMLGAIMSK